MKKFSVPCDFEGVKSPFTIYVGSARADHHPLHFQADWLSKERGGTIPTEVMESLSKLQELARKNNAKFEDLCVYALGAAQEDGDEDVVAEPEDNSDDDFEETEEGSSEEASSEDEPEEDMETEEDEAKSREEDLDAPEDSDEPSEKDPDEDLEEIERALEKELEDLKDETSDKKNKDTKK